MNLLFRNHKARRERVLRKMAAMRAAKDRHRMGNQLEPRPSVDKPAPFLEFGVRDVRSGEAGWVPFVSLRDAMRRLAVVRKYYQPST